MSKHLNCTRPIRIDKSKHPHRASGNLCYCLLSLNIPATRFMRVPGVMYIHSLKKKKKRAESKSEERAAVLVKLRMARIDNKSGPGVPAQRGRFRWQRFANAAIRMCGAYRTRKERRAPTKVATAPSRCLGKGGGGRPARNLIYRGNRSLFLSRRSSRLTSSIDIAV